jgi:hypothetical protein
MKLKDKYKSNNNITQRKEIIHHIMTNSHISYNLII